MLGLVCQSGWIAGFDASNLTHQVAEKHLPQSNNRAEASSQGLFMSGVLETSQLLLLLQVDLVRIDGAAGKVE